MIFHWIVSDEAALKTCVFPSPGSSTDVSEDWEKDFDLDMTEEEVQMALSKIEDSGEVSVVTLKVP